MARQDFLKKGRELEKGQFALLKVEGEVEAITRKAVELAKTGELAAIRICMDRIVPSRQDRHVIFELPKIETPADAVKACLAVKAGFAA